jgi:hypothetical protein
LPSKLQPTQNPLPSTTFPAKTGLDPDLGVAQQISNGIGHQSLLLETMIKEERNTQKRLISIQQDLRDTLQESLNKPQAEAGPV